MQPRGGASSAQRGAARGPAGVSAPNAAAAEAAPAIRPSQPQPRQGGPQPSLHQQRPRPQDGGNGAGGQQAAEDLARAREALRCDPGRGLELLASLAMAGAEVAVAAGGGGAAAGPVREAVGALMGALTDLATRPSAWPPHRVSALADDPVLWATLAAALACAYRVDDGGLATAVLRGWRAAAEALLPAAGGADAAEGEAAAAEEEEGVLLRLERVPVRIDLSSPAAALVPASDGAAVDDLLCALAAAARRLAPLRGLAGRLAALLSAFAAATGVHPCPGAGPLQALALWAHVLLHPPRDDLGDEEGEEAEEAAAAAALGSACRALYGLAGPALQRWVAQHRERSEAAAAAAAGEGQAAAAAAPGQDATEAAAGGGLAEEEAAQQKQVPALEEPLAPPVLFFRLMWTLLQDDDTVDAERWSPAFAAALEQTAQQVFAALGGSAEAYAACMAALFAGARESLAAAAGPTVTGTAAAAGAWAADPGVGRLGSLLLSYGGLSLVLRAELARAGEDKRKASAVLSTLVALCRPAHAPALAASAPGRGARGSPLRRLVGVLCGLLLPESNCGVELRLAALQALASALDQHLTALEEQAGGGGGGGGAGDGGAAAVARHAAALWDPVALDALLFCVGHDPSVKVRRAAMRVVAQVVLPAGGGGAARLARALASRLRDRDAMVSDRALELLTQLPVDFLTSAVQGGGGGGNGGGGGSGADWPAAVRHCVSAMAEADVSGGRRGLAGRVPGCCSLLSGALEHEVAAAAREPTAPPTSAAAAAARRHPVALLLSALLPAQPGLVASAAKAGTAAGGAVKAGGGSGGGGGVPEEAAEAAVAAAVAELRRAVAVAQAMELDA
ncbi:hypothetical protein HYH03_012948 [Edaphochlamys debaryana]|uniref:Uncharacterized protein n=1 Tax=Edaphochlamys debaryana TaxID=47281 RepID=A0A836BTD8_9CHLO|nr:hypothetical protein HYH03_012948 [Edaphochlamys debaryana]|eukprot:KAG2488441.1 hypothetical protein HYH03_012948 [Edaphochlamys debaryana]